MKRPQRQIVLSGYRNNNRGVTLVEVMVAAVILAIIIVSMVGVIRKVRDMQVTDNHRRQARAYIHEQLERVYTYTRYNSITDKDSTYSQLLDAREGSPLNANVHEMVTTTNLAIQDGSAPVKKINITVSWIEPDSIQDSVAIQKWISNVQ